MTSGAERFTPRPSLSMMSSPSFRASSWEVISKDLFGLLTLTRKLISFGTPASTRIAVSRISAYERGTAST